MKKDPELKLKQAIVGLIQDYEMKHSYPFRGRFTRLSTEIVLKLRTKFSNDGLVRLQQIVKKRCKELEKTIPKPFGGR